MIAFSVLHPLMPSYRLTFDAKGGIEGRAMEDFALALLRVTVGVLFVGHGSQKLFGAFGGDGIEATSENFAKMRLRDPRAAAIGVAMYELFGGALLALGLLTPIACAFILGVM